MPKFLPVKGVNKEDLLMPERKTMNSAGYDISAYEETVIPSRKVVLVRTGLKVQMNSDEVLMIFPRSSLCRKKSLFLANQVGVIDADYFSNQDNDGEIGLLLYNFSENEVKILKGERIAQGVFTKYLVCENEKTISTIRVGGFGSTEE